jgi:mannose-6-phosphate isomerase-like protein (cupin superfamily)
MHSLVLALCLLTLAGCVGRPPAPHLLTADPPNRAAVTSLAPPLAPGDNIRPTELRRAESSSLALVQVRDREQPHVHTRYDLTVTLARGSGTLWLDGAPQPMREGDIAFIPKGTPHYFVNEGSEPATALVVFAPPFSGPDQGPLAAPGGGW